MKISAQTITRGAWSSVGTPICVLVPRVIDEVWTLKT